MNTNRQRLQSGIKNRILARILFWVGVICFIGPVAILHFAPIFYEAIKPIVLEYWTISCVALILLSGLYLHNAKCPRCGNRFSVTQDGFIWNDFADRCVNCDLSLRKNDSEEL
jgi:hypothetical protein